MKLFFSLLHLGNRAEDIAVISAKEKKKESSRRMKVLKNSAGCKMQREHLSYLIHYKFISNTDTCILTTLQQKNCNLNGYELYTCRL